MNKMERLQGVNETIAELRSDSLTLGDLCGQICNYVNEEKFLPAELQDRTMSCLQNIKTAQNCCGEGFDALTGSSELPVTFAEAEDRMDKLHDLFCKEEIIQAAVRFRKLVTENPEEIDALSKAQERIVIADPAEMTLEGCRERYQPYIDFLTTLEEDDAGTRIRYVRKLEEYFTSELIAGAVITRDIHDPVEKEIPFVEEDLDDYDEGTEDEAIPSVMSDEETYDDPTTFKSLMEEVVFEDFEEEPAGEETEVLTELIEEKEAPAEEAEEAEVLAEAIEEAEAPAEETEEAEVLAEAIEEAEAPAEEAEEAEVLAEVIEETEAPAEEIEGAEISNGETEEMPQESVTIDETVEEISSEDTSVREAVSGESEDTAAEKGDTFRGGSEEPETGVGEEIGDEKQEDGSDEETKEIRGESELEETEESGAECDNAVGSEEISAIKNYLDDFDEKYIEYYRMATGTEEVENRLAAWPKTGETFGREGVKNVFDSLGFHVESIEDRERIRDKYENYKVILRKEDIQLNGEKSAALANFRNDACADGFRVVCLYGAFSGEELSRAFREIGNRHHTVILFQNPVTQGVRRSLVRLVRREGLRKIFAVLDRVAYEYMNQNYREEEINRIFFDIIMPGPDTE